MLHAGKHARHRHALHTRLGLEPLDELLLHERAPFLEGALPDPGREVDGDGEVLLVRNAHEVGSSPGDLEDRIEAGVRSPDNALYTLSRDKPASLAT